MTVIEVLVHVVVCPPGIVIVSVLRIVEVAGGSDKPGEVGDNGPVVVVVTLVEAVD
jgi:hypothetical protein